VGLVVVLVGYPLSIGPACWLVGENETAMDAILNVYYPILWLVKISRHEVRPGLFEQGPADRCVKWYATLGRKDGASPIMLSSGDTAWAVPPGPDPGP